MKQITEISDNLSVITERRGHSVIISLEENNELLFSKEVNIKYNRLIQYKGDDNYIIFYWMSDDDAKIFAAYNRQDKRLVDLKDKNTNVAIQYMYIIKRPFPLTTVLQFLNDFDVKTASKNEVDAMSTFLTSGNENISREEIKNHILISYPNLIDYINFDRTITVLECDKLKWICEPVLFLHKMPQIIDEEKDRKVVRQRQK